jgi:ATP-dependent Clp protease ATP-binding subunit ClpC
MVEAAKRNIRERRLPDAAILVLERCIAKAKMGQPLTAESGTQVEENDLVEVMADILNLPESNISVSLKNRLLQLRDNIQKRIIGQEAAIETLASAVIASKLGYDIKKSKPDGIFLFIGPTGVGKTETALALCEALYGNLDFLIRIDMSEYMEKYTYSRFVGAAPGYVGYYDSNQLTDKVRQSPYAVILLDEIEKADSQLLNIFLQVFDAGRLTDARGNVVDFSKATIIMTSNIGTALFGKANLGYRTDSDGTRVSRSSLLKALKKYFSPEFLNRIDEIVVFKQLDKRDIKKIIAIHLQELRRELDKEGKELVLREEVVDYIVRQGYSSEYGARHLGRTIKKELLEKIALLSLEKEWPEGRFVVCSLGEQGIEIRQESFNQELASPTDSCLANEGGGEP